MGTLVAAGGKLWDNVDYYLEKKLCIYIYTCVCGGGSNVMQCNVM